MEDVNHQPYPRRSETWPSAVSRPDPRPNQSKVGNRPTILLCDICHLEQKTYHSYDPPYCSELNSTYKECAHYFVGVKPRVRRERYRPLTAAQMKLRHTPMPPPPRLAGLTGQKRLDKIRNSIGPIERLRTAAMIALASSQDSEPRRKRRPAHAQAKPGEELQKPKKPKTRSRSAPKKTAHKAAVDRLKNNALIVRNSLTQHCPPPRGGEG